MPKNSSGCIFPASSPKCFTALVNWEKEGFKSAAEQLSIFIEYGKDGDSLLNFNPLLKTSKATLENKISENVLEELLSSDEFN